MSLNSTSPIFIVGAQRSGTTWLQRLLSDHPLIAGGEESHLFDGYLAPMWDRWNQEEQMRQSGGRNIGLQCYLSEEEFITQMRQFAWASLSKTTQDKPDATLLLEKTPDHGLHLPLIHRLFPQAIIIHMLRDGRDVVASMMNAHRQQWGRDWTPVTVADAAKRWSSWVNEIQSNLSLFEHTLTVKYEQLIEHGPNKLAELFESLNVPLPVNQIEAIHDRWRFDNASQSATEPEGFYRRGTTGSWQQDLSQGDLELIELITGPTLQQYNYLDSEPTSTEEAITPGGFQSLIDYDDILWRKPGRLKILETSDAQMLPRERLYLYSTVFALAPERCLEIGVSQGGSSQIIHAALADLGKGRLIGIDPSLQLTYDPAKLEEYVTFLAASSPDGLSEACELAGGLFDFVLLDGDHDRRGVRNDIEGLIDVTSEGAIVLAHDAYFSCVAEGIQDALDRGVPFFDGGVVSTTAHHGIDDGHQVSYAGFRLLIRTSGGVRKLRKWQSMTRSTVSRIARKMRRVVGSTLQTMHLKD